jgi:hypothetical protein
VFDCLSKANWYGVIPKKYFVEIAGVTRSISSGKEEYFSLDALLFKNTSKGIMFSMDFSPEEKNPRISAQ